MGKFPPAAVIVSVIFIQLNTVPLVKTSVSYTSRVCVFKIEQQFFIQFLVDCNFIERKFLAIKFV